MVFSDLFFLFAFLPAFALCYLLAAGGDKLLSRACQADAVARQAPRCTGRNAVLCIFSLLFYAWGEPVYVFLMLGVVVMNFFSGLVIDRTEGRSRKTAVVVGVALNLCTLGVFKYAGLLCTSLQAAGIPIPVPHIALPIGISFYIFQSITYLVDVYRRDFPVQRRFGGLLLYISMFPQLIAGPIVRYGTVAEEINRRHVSAADFADGAYRFLLGLGKKVIVANQFSTIVDALLKNGFADLTPATAWVGITAFALQIYFDFSGYSDMAIGLGRCLGFHFNENFRHPYCCNSITDFWRRWHISLGTFFRDYVYIPLGGNRRHQAFNILFVWLLTGAWHGASWNFFLWGVYFGVIVMLEKYTILRWRRYIPDFLLHIYGLLLVLIGWGIFYFEDFAQMTQFFTVFFNLGGLQSDFIARTTLLDNAWLWLVALVFCLPVRGWLGKGCARLLRPEGFCFQALRFGVRLSLSLALMLLSTALLVGATNNAFIYTRF